LALIIGRSAKANRGSVHQLGIKWPQLTPVDLEIREILLRPEESVTTVYFVKRSWLSMLAPLEDGDVAEVGLVGLPVILGEP
jgi:CRP-like cAMP-binding protein